MIRHTANITGLTIGERLLILRALQEFTPSSDEDLDHVTSLIEQFEDDLEYMYFND